MSAVIEVVDELEELLKGHVPCGGNILDGPCPFAAEATMICVDRHDNPCELKCEHCFVKWYTQASRYWPVAQCKKCGLTLPIGKWYRPL